VATIRTSDGTALAYDTAGSGRPGMLFIHGWNCDRSFFAPQYEHFATTQRVVAHDQRGHGDSDRPGAGYSIEQFVDDALTVAAAAGLERPVVVGHSLGGLVAMATAARPGAVAAAVMVDPAPLVLTDEMAAIFDPIIASVAADDDGSYRATFANQMFLPTDDASRRGRIVKAMGTQSPAVSAAVLAAIRIFDGAAALAAVNVPLLSIGSAVPINADAALREHCPEIVIGQTVGSGHFNQLEVPDQVNAMIERFLQVTGVMPDSVANSGNSGESSR